MTPYQAVIATAELLEERPEAYEFQVCEIPDDRTLDFGCLLGWIGHFLGFTTRDIYPAGAERVSDRVGDPGLCLVTKSLGHSVTTSSEFYYLMYQIEKELGGNGCKWSCDPAVAAKSLRHFATEHLVVEGCLGSGKRYDQDSGDLVTEEA